MFTMISYGGGCCVLTVLARYVPGKMEPHACGWSITAVKSTSSPKEEGGEPNRSLDPSAGCKQVLTIYISYPHKKAQ